ncbi:spore germination protein YaaH [Kineothrix alysoides]|uniref:Spore germination protein YaaH n=1 Tax=Kineothrix alysoides TaxID=1469948 RepID=A0A4R1R6T6_9FIRM|nr:glycosyl hydrolase family 18 protein [Kineothrix alysoides]TCL61022.1 spore germination protein YaaH [Kineothrix alysoides]
MKKLIPAITAVVLIIVVIAISVGIKIMDKYSYSKERKDLDEYFSIESADEVPIILQDELIEESARLIEGTYYLDLATVHKYFNDRFYEDGNEGLLLLTLPQETVRSEIGSSQYSTSAGDTSEEYVISRYEGDTFYIAIDYVKKYANFSYEAFTDPNHVQIFTKWEDRKTAQLTKDTAVRYQGGVKSPILTDVAEGDTVTVIEEMEKWSKVKTSDAFIGYVENKQLDNYGTQSPIPVTDYEEPIYANISKPYKINLAWHAVAGTAGNDTLASALEKTKGINTISPTWFALSDNDGNFTSFATRDYVSKAHDQGIEVWGLIDNFTNKETVDTYEVLSYTSKRTYLIGNLISTALEYDLDGINVDFEEISQDAGEHFIQFIRELSVACRANGIVLSVDNYVPTGYTDHYDREEQGAVADYVVIMGYDEYYKGSSEAGSVASIGFVENGIKKTVEQVPAQKVINAIPFYTRIWETKGAELTSQAVGMDLAEEFVQNHNIETRWDEETCQNYGEIQEGDSFYQVWLEDEQSIEVKLNIMQKYDIAGVAEWKLGFEKASVWDVIGNYLNK